MGTETKIEAQQGFAKEEPKGPKPAAEDIITKEETMFRVDEAGKAIPEKFPVEIYDRNLDRELIAEGLCILETEKKKKQPPEPQITFRKKTR